MTRWLLPATWLVFLGSFGWNLWFWGGLSLDPSLGPALAARVERQVSLPATYVGLGRPLLRWLGQDRRAAESAPRRLLQSPAALLEGPGSTLVERVVAALPPWTRLPHRAAPWLLLAGLVLAWSKPRPVRVTTIGRR